MKKAFVTTVVEGINKIEIMTGNPPGGSQVAKKVRVLLFYKSFPRLQGPWVAEWVGTDNVELGWRYAEKLGFTTGKGRPAYKFGYEERGWTPD